jgi:2,4-dienoyl-CoA reductase-like NADH-dependent reductase (Old Yellow Enzyme family)
MSMTVTGGKILFEEFIGDRLQLKNRIALAPMTRISATEDGCATETMRHYYGKFARGGFGLIISEGVYPDESHSQGYLFQPGMANLKQLNTWTKVVKEVQAAGAKMICQLMHAGAVSQGNIYTDTNIGPSSVLPKGEMMSFYRGEGPFPVPKEMDLRDIEQVKAGFIQAAVYAEAAGFDGVEIHGANGYLLDQFLTDYTNRRTDAYGGSTANRVRLIVEIIQGIRSATDSSRFAVGIRISQLKGNDGTYKWQNGEEDAKIIFGKIGEAGPDYIHVTEPDALKPAFAEGPTLVCLAKKYGNVPVIANGNLQDPKAAEAIVACKDADIASIGKGALANQDWPVKWARDLPLNDFHAQKHLMPLAYIRDHEI